MHQSQMMINIRRQACGRGVLSVLLWRVKCRWLCFVFQERTGVKMIMIQDGPMPTGADKPLRITGDPYKVQVSGPS